MRNPKINPAAGDRLADKHFTYEVTYVAGSQVHYEKRYQSVGSPASKRFCSLAGWQDSAKNWTVKQDIKGVTP